MSNGITIELIFVIRRRHCKFFLKAIIRILSLILILTAVLIDYTVSLYSNRGREGFHEEL